MILRKQGMLNCHFSSNRKEDKANPNPKHTELTRFAYELSFICPFQEIKLLSGLPQNITDLYL